jgi:cation:H+ antiporter
MVLFNAFLFFVSLIVVVKSAEYCTRYATQLAKMLHLSEFTVSFFIVALISTFPEATISIFSAINGVPELGLGTLLGSNIADLTLVFGIVALMSQKGVRVKSEILKKDFLYLVLLLFPIILGWDGFFSRMDGLLLVLGGVFFFYSLSMESRMFRKKWGNLRNFHAIKNAFFLFLAIAALMISAEFTVKYGTDFAYDLRMPAALVGLTIISIGTCLPELIFSVKAVRSKHDSLALGDILGTVVTDATIVLGVVAIINPFSFKPALIYLTGFAMFFAGLLAIVFISSEKTLTKKEGVYLLFFYIAYLVSEFIANKMM